MTTEVIKEMKKDVPGTKAWASKLRSDAKKIAARISTDYMELAKALYLVYDTPVNGDPNNGPLYESWGYASFAEYAEKELGLQRRKAEHLRKIYFRLEVELELEQEVKDRIVRLGWSKVREIIRVITSDNVLDWVERAEKSHHPELCAAIRVYLDNSEDAESSEEGVDGEAGEKAEPPALDPDEKFFFEEFALAEGQHENVKKALDRAGELSDSSKGSHNLDLICTEFLATNDFSADNEESRARYIAKTEQLLKVKLIAIDPKTNDVVYGLDTLKELAGDASAEDSFEASAEDS